MTLTTLRYCTVLAVGKEPSRGGCRDYVELRIDTRSVELMSVVCVLLYLLLGLLVCSAELSFRLKLRGRRREIAAAAQLGMLCLSVAEPLFEFSRESLLKRSCIVRQLGPDIFADSRFESGCVSDDVEYCIVKSHRPQAAVIQSSPSHGIVEEGHLHKLAHLDSSWSRSPQTISTHDDECCSGEGSTEAFAMRVQESCWRVVLI